MKIETKNIEAIFTFSPATHYLVRAKDERFKDGGLIWSLNSRIDRSEKGKDDDVGMPELYLSDEDAEKLQGSFSWVEM